MCLCCWMPLLLFAHRHTARALWLETHSLPAASGRSRLCSTMRLHHQIGAPHDDGRGTAGRCDRLSRYEATLWRRVGQILFALDALDHRKPQERRRRFLVDDRQRTAGLWAQ